MHRLPFCAVLIIAITGFLIAGAGERAEAVCDGTCIPQTAADVAAAAYDAGFRGGALVYSIAVSAAESRSDGNQFNLNAIHDNDFTSTKCTGTPIESIDYGLWQINTAAHCDYLEHGQDLLYDASYNAAAAYQISSVGSNWCPWTTFWNGAFKQFLDSPARTAAQAIDSTVIRPTTKEFSRVMATSDVNVRDTVGGSFLRTVTAGTTGTVLDGPQVQPFGTCPNTQPHYYIWWKIHWDDDEEDGWSVEDVMARIEVFPCHRFDSDDPIPSPYGAAYNILSPEKELLLKAFCAQNVTDIVVGNGNETGNTAQNYTGLMYIYNKAYYYTTQWNPITLTCAGTDTTPVSNIWCKGKAEGSIPTTSNWFVGYSCERRNSRWNCGCTNASCTGTPFWQLQGVQR